MKAVESKKAASAICAILAISIMCLRLSQAQTPDSVPRKLVLEVIVKDCPHDAQIRREDLRLFSDGTAEAHSLSTFRWYDSVEERKISVHEYDVLRAILENRELLQVKYRYERMYPVMDSWTEWEIRVRHQSGDQTIEISAFSPLP